VIDPIQAQLAAMRVRTGHVAIAYRKPGKSWQWRTVAARRLEATVLKLEDEGAEIVTRETEEGGNHGSPTH
jgi:hypothetical protein